MRFDFLYGWNILKEIKTERGDVHKGEKDKIQHNTATGKE
jgi:hypothetical protein